MDRRPPNLGNGRDAQERQSGRRVRRIYKTPQDSTQPPPENRKRRADEAISGDKKRARVIPNVPSGEPKPFRALDEEQNLIPDLRCAYYAIERLRAAYHVTHTMAVLLEGKYNFFALRIP